MDQDKRIALARLYVARSNDHDIAGVMQLLDEFATYRSNKVGTFSGRQEIQKMMEEFFELFPDVHWHVENYDNGPADSVEFDFRMTATHAESGQPVERRGHERVSFTSRDRIRQVTVTVRE